MSAPERALVKSPLSRALATRRTSTWSRTDDEFTTVLSLAQVKQLAAALGVETAALFVDDVTRPERRITYDELVTLVRGHLATGVSKRRLKKKSVGISTAFWRARPPRFPVTA